MKKEQAPTQTSLNAKSTENQCFYLVAGAFKLSNSKKFINDFLKVCDYAEN